tara:strand:- start:275 stop:655 length:381 start_codon:yes stop_codon:yes gene_type:complete
MSNDNGYVNKTLTNRGKVLDALDDMFNYLQVRLNDLEGRINSISTATHVDFNINDYVHKDELSEAFECFRDNLYVDSYDVTIEANVDGDMSVRSDGIDRVDLDSMTEKRQNPPVELPDPVEGDDDE